MKRIAATDEAITFELDPRERDALEHLLRLYPVVPLDHYVGSRDAEQQRVIHESLSAERAANKRQVNAWLETPDRFTRHKDRCHLHLKRDEIEWFLQVTNDIRVGHWLLLGSPDLEKITEDYVTLETFPSLALMQTAAHFQMCILEAVK